MNGITAFDCIDHVRIDAVEETLNGVKLGRRPRVKGARELANQRYADFCEGLAHGFGKVGDPPLGLFLQFLQSRKLGGDGSEGRGAVDRRTVEASVEMAGSVIGCFANVLEPLGR